MKGKWKMFCVIGAVFILASVGTLMPVVASEQTEVANTDKEKAAAFEQQRATLSEREKAKITRIMSKYTEKTVDGTLQVTVDGARGLLISEQELKLYEEGINRLNAMVAAGEIEIIKTSSGEFVGKLTDHPAATDVPETYSEYVALVEKLDISQEQKEQLLSITEEQWNAIKEKLEERGSIATLGGKNDYKRVYHWWGYTDKLWLDHSTTELVCLLMEGGAGALSIAHVLLMVIEGATVIGTILIIVEEIIGHGGAWWLEQSDEGNGVRIEADFIWGAPVPFDFDVYPQ